MSDELKRLFEKLANLSDNQMRELVNDSSGLRADDTENSCNFCDYFSGNTEVGMGIRPAWCCHPDFRDLPNGPPCVDEDDMGCHRRTWNEVHL